MKYFTNLAKSLLAAMLLLCVSTTSRAGWVEDEKLITSADQFSSNCQWNSDYPYSFLIDGNHNTHFHSNANVSLFDTDEWLQVDLARDDVSKIIFEYWGRNDGAAVGVDWHDTPTKIMITASNTPDDDNSWVEITTLDEGFPGNVHNAHYTSPMIDLGTDYRYLRFHIQNTSSGNPYWNLSEFQVYTVEEVDDLVNLLDSVNALNLNLETTDKLGYYTRAAVEAYYAKLTECTDLLDKEDATKEELAKAREELCAALAALKASVITPGDGNWIIYSANPDFSVQPRAMYASGGQLRWGVFDSKVPSFYFNIKKLDDGNILVRNLYDGSYIGWGEGDARTPSNTFVPTIDTDTVEQVVTIASEGKFYISNTMNPAPNYYHPVGNGGGSGKDGLVYPASGEDPISQWTFEQADTTGFSRMAAEYPARLRAGELAEDIDGLGAMATVVKMKAPANGLLKKASQLRSNCAWGSTVDADKLIDGDTSSMFHSDPNSSMFTTDEWLQLDLGADDISKFIIEYYGRNDVPAFHETPNWFTITATNTPDDDASWKEITSISSSAIPNESGAHYVSPVVDMGAAYRYVRFHARSTTANSAYWNMTEMQLYKTPLEASASSLYSKKPEAKTATDQLEAALAIADGHMANLTVDGTELAAITEAINAINAIEDEIARLQAIVDSANALYATLFVTDNPEASQYNAVDGMKDAADKMQALATTLQGKLDAATATTADGQELQNAINAVNALYQDRAGLESLISKAEDILANITEGQDMGQLSDGSTLDPLQTAVDAAKVSTSSTTEFNTRRDNLQNAYDAVVGAIVQPEPGKWYYIISATAEDDASGEAYYPARQQVRGAALYVLSDGGPMYKGDQEGNYDADDELRWGMDEIKGKAREGDVDALWRFIAAPDSFGKRAYYIQNLRTGFYVGNTASVSDHKVLQQDSTYVPYRIDYIGSETFNLVALAGNHAGVPISFGDNAHQVRTDAIAQTPGNRASLTFEEFDTEENSDVNIDFFNDSARILTLPFAVSDLGRNDGVRAYSIHSVVKNEEGLGIGIGLTQKEEFAAGEPFILVVGDTTKHTAESGYKTLTFSTPAADAMLTKLVADTVNGLIGTFPNTVSLTDKNHDYLFLRGHILRINSPAFLDTTRYSGYYIYAHTGYIDPVRIVDQEGEPDVIMYTPQGTFHTGIINAIKGAKAVRASETVSVYTVDGALVRKNVSAAKAAEGLRKGLYIIGREKVLVK